MRGKKDYLVALADGTAARGAWNSASSIVLRKKKVRHRVVTTSSKQAVTLRADVGYSLRGIATPSCCIKPALPKKRSSTTTRVTHATQSAWVTTELGATQSALSESWATQSAHGAWWVATWGEKVGEVKNKKTCLLFAFATGTRCGGPRRRRFWAARMLL